MAGRIVLAKGTRHIIKCQARSFVTSVSVSVRPREEPSESGVSQDWSQDRISPGGVLSRYNPGELSGSDGPLQPGVPLTAPQVDPVSQHELDTLAEYIQDSRNLVVVTGAGCSTESNIPDYRGPKGAYSTGFKPMTHQQFMGSPKTRARYWARSFAGWHQFSRIQPNRAHEALARLQNLGWIDSLITQNVDRLHHKAGSRNVIELHGTTHRVICMNCGEITHRQKLQDKLLEMNPGAAQAIQQMVEEGKRLERADDDELDAIPVVRPDGDVELRDAGKGFLIPPCDQCGGVLKPNVVFFGDGIPKPRAEMAIRTAGSCDTLMIVGSSMQVYSAYRLAKAASDAAANVVILTAGETRADKHASYKVEALAGEALARLASHPSLLIPRA